MILCDVIGNVVMTEKSPKFIGEKIMMLKALDNQMKASGQLFLAIDRVQCGIGDRVLALREGSGVRQIIGREQGLAVDIAVKEPVPIKSMVVAMVDEVNVV